MTFKTAFLFLCCCAVTGVQAASEVLSYQEQVIVAGGERRVVRIPVGYRLELLTDKLDGPRMLTFAANGDLFIGSRSGQVYRLPPPYTTPTVPVTLSGYPHSVAVRGADILIARTNGLYQAPYKPGQGRLAPETLKLLAALPDSGGHSSRSVAVGTDGALYFTSDSDTQGLFRLRRI